VACGDPVVDDFANAVRAVIDDADAAPDRFLRRFCEVVGVPAHVLPDPPLRVLIKGVRQLHGARPPDEAMLPLDDLAASGFPMLVVSGGHHPASEIICDTIARRTGGLRAVWGTWSKTRVRPSMHCWRASFNQPKPTGPQRWEVAHHDRSSAHC
jgi:hypothetical protein